MACQNDKQTEMYKKNRITSANNQCGSTEFISDTNIHEPFNMESNNISQNQDMAHREYKNLNEYARVLRSWLWQYQMNQQLYTFHAQMMWNIHQHCMFQAATNASLPTTPSPRAAPSSTTRATGAEHATPQREGTVQYRVPLLWRRIVAEFLDFVLLFYLKVLVTVAVLRQLGYMNEDILEMDAQLPFLNDFAELDYDKMFSLTSELIALEVINRSCITLVETMCIKQGYAGSIGGATPGKKIMQLRVVSFDEIRASRDRYVTLTAARDPGFVSALVRSVIKNFSMAFFFPASLTVFFFRYNRAAYDILSNTIVVEVDPIQRN